MTTDPQQIVALGGGGFSMEPDVPLLDDFILSLAVRQPARICFVPTASSESEAYLVKFYRAFSGRAIASDIVFNASPSLPRHPARTADLEAHVAQQDIIYVGGGNTANLLAIWRTHGLDRILRAAWERGTILCGISAGMLCWFEDGVTDSFGGLARLGDGLGFLPGSACPHYDGEAHRQEVYRDAIRAGMPAGYAADDGVGLHFRGTALVDVVTSRPGRSAHRLELVDGALRETVLPAREL